MASIWHQMLWGSPLPLSRLMRIVLGVEYNLADGKVRRRGPLAFVCLRLERASFVTLLSQLPADDAGGEQVFPRMPLSKRRTLDRGPVL
jgi:hypothetical protein